MRERRLKEDVLGSYCHVTKHPHIQELVTTSIYYYSSCFYGLVMDWLVQDELPIDLSWTCLYFVDQQGWE